MQGDFMAFAIARTKKLKGGSVAASGEHADRARQTPNADPLKTPENKLLIGKEDEPLQVGVKRVIEAHGGRPRKDSVECVEHMLSASPEYFINMWGTHVGKNVEANDLVKAFTERALQFIEEREKKGEICVKAVLHLDEKTPHVSAYTVPIDPEGKLNAKHFYGGRQKMRDYQEHYAQVMSPLGLERGVEGSRATHVDVKKFYGTIIEKVAPKINYDLVPDPPKVLVTENQRKEYKRAVVKSLNEQITPHLTQMRNQAMLTIEEKGKRVAAESQLRLNIEDSQKAGLTLSRTSMENSRLSFENGHLKTNVENLTIALDNKQRSIQPLIGQVRQLQDEMELLNNRVKDIPLRQIMEAFGYKGEEQNQALLYRNDAGQVALKITGQEAVRGSTVVAQNAVDLTQYIQTMRAGNKTSVEEATEFLADHFGAQQSVSAVLTQVEQHVTERMTVREQQKAQELVQELVQDIEMSM